MNIHSTLNNEITDVDSHLMTLLTSPFPELNSIFQDLAQSKGKRVRAQYCFCCYHIFQDCSSSQLISTASAIELIHLATLVHDDIIDDAKLRRHQPSIQAKYGKDMAVYAGDYLFTEYFSLIRQFDKKDSILTDAHLDVMKTILAGELFQRRHYFDLQQTLETSWNIMKRKTGALLALSGFSGAYLANASMEDQQLCAEIGLLAGCLFQITDDLLDILQSDAKTGKNSHHDFIEGIYTLPLLLAYPKDKAFFDTLLTPQLTNEQNQKVIRRIIELGGIQKTEAIIHQIQQRIHQLTCKLPQNDWNQFLTQLIDKMIHRQA